MKKFIFASALAMVVLASCTGTTQKEDTTKDSPVVADTVNVDTVAADSACVQK